MVIILIAAAWPKIARAITSDEESFYTSPTEYTALLAAVDPFKAPVRPVVRSSGSNNTQILDPAIQAKIEAEFGVGHIMYWVAVNESALVPSAANPSGAKGLFQIVGITWRGYGCTGNVFNTDDNIRCARKIYDKRGLKDWEWSRHEGFDGGWGKRL